MDPKLLTLFEYSTYNRVYSGFEYLGIDYPSLSLGDWIPNTYLDGFKEFKLCQHQNLLKMNAPNLTLHIFLWNWGG